MRCTALHCTALQCAALHCASLHFTALHYTALHCTALHYTALTEARAQYHSWTFLAVNISFNPLSSILTSQKPHHCKTGQALPVWHSSNVLKTRQALTSSATAPPRTSSTNGKTPQLRNPSLFIRIIFWSNCAIILDIGCTKSYKFCQSFSNLFQTRNMFAEICLTTLFVEHPHVHRA